MLSKCPTCEQLLSHATCNAIAIRPAGAQERKGLAHCCPFCQTILGVEIDPIAVRTEIVAQIEETLTRVLRGR